MAGIAAKYGSHGPIELSGCPNQRMEGMTTSLLEPESANGNNCLAHVSNIPDDKPPMHVWNENTVVMRVFHALTRIGVSDRGLTSLNRADDKSSSNCAHDYTLVDVHDSPSTNTEPKM